MMKLPEINEIVEKVKHWKSDETNYYKTLPPKYYFYAVIALVGIVATCLPWASVTVGFYNEAIGVGLRFFKGWLVFLIYIAVFGIMLLNKHLKIRKEFYEKVPLYGASATTALTLLFMIWKLFHVKFGVYLCLLISVVFLFAIWYFEYRNKIKR